MTKHSEQIKKEYQKAKRKLNKGLIKSIIFLGQVEEYHQMGRQEDETWETWIEKEHQRLRRLGMNQIRSRREKLLDNRLPVQLMRCRNQAGRLGLRGYSTAKQ